MSTETKVVKTEEGEVVKTDEENFADAFDESVAGAKQDSNDPAEAAKKKKEEEERLASTTNTDDGILNKGPDDVQDTTVVTTETDVIPGETATDYEALYEKERQKTLSWDGRIKAANKRADDAEAALKAKEDAAERATIDPPATDSTLDEFFTEFPDLKEPLTVLVQTEVDSRVKAAIDSALGEIKPTITTLQQNAKLSDDQLHFNAIVQAHPDFEAIRDSGKLKAWIDAQSPIIKASLTSVFEKGSATQVIEMFDMYKRSVKPKQTTTSTGDLSSKAKALMAVPGSTDGPPSETKTKAVTYDDAWAEANSS